MAAAPAIPLDPQPQERAWDADLVGWLPKARSDTWTTLNAAVLPVPCSCASDTAGAQRLTARGLSEHRHSSTSSPNLSVRDAQTPACACAAFRALSQHGGFQFRSYKIKLSGQVFAFQSVLITNVILKPGHTTMTPSHWEPPAPHHCVHVCVCMCACAYVCARAPTCVCRVHVCTLCVCRVCTCAYVCRVHVCLV